MLWLHLGFNRWPPDLPAQDDDDDDDDDDEVGVWGAGNYAEGSRIGFCVRVVARVTS